MSLKTFVAEAFTNFNTVAAVTPSSKYLASAMLAPLPLAKARVILEFGAGTGAITQALLAKMPPRTKLLIFEINPRFYEYLRRSITDPRAVVVNASAENFDTELHRLGLEQVDGVASSLGLAFMPDPQRHALFQKLAPYWHEAAVFTQYQYIHGMQCNEGRIRRLDLRPLLNSYFGSVHSKIVWRNLPPAWVHTCHVQAVVPGTHLSLGWIRGGLRQTGLNPRPAKFGREVH